jgi:FAD/FMN-containing dehydrogenase
MIPAALIPALTALLGPSFVKTDDASLVAYGVDALKRGARADVVVLPANTQEVAAFLRVRSRAPVHFSV